MANEECPHPWTRGGAVMATWRKRAALMDGSEGGWWGGRKERVGRKRITLANS